MSDVIRPGPPEAIVRSGRRISLAWILPLLAVVLAGWLGYRAWTLKGIGVSVGFQNGHGLKPGDEVRYRGISVGEVKEIRLTADGDGIEAHLALRQDASRFARAGARFWIVRPQISLSGVRGVETILGRRYVAAMPGKGDARHRFTGQEEPRIVDDPQPGDLEIVLESRDRGNLDPGTLVTYREVKIGTILSVGLAGDGRTVESRAHIEKAYVPLIRERTRFFFASGVGANWGSKLLWMEFEGNLARMGLGGSVAVATPERGGEVVRTGHRFALYEEPEDDWLEWRPSIAVGSAHLPPGTVAPQPLRVRLTWRAGLFKRTHARQGWLLQTTDGLIGPLDLLRTPADAAAGSTRLEVDGQLVPIQAVAELGAGLGRLPAQIGAIRYTVESPRPPEEPVDCVAVTDRPDTPLALTAHRLTFARDSWVLDESVSLSDDWHGAVVLARDTGLYLGCLLVRDGTGRVALLDRPEVADSQDPAGLEAPAAAGEEEP